MILVVEPMERRLSAALAKAALPLPLFITKPPAAVIAGALGAAALTAAFAGAALGAAAWAGAANVPVSRTAPAAVTAVADRRRTPLMPVFNVFSPNAASVRPHERVASS